MIISLLGGFLSGGFCPVFYQYEHFNTHKIQYKHFNSHKIQKHLNMFLKKHSMK
jgi:hypothetical protein